jgi:uncharacterized membrane protein YhaH (DUF805 family)
VVTSNKLYKLLFKGWFRIKGRSGRQEYILRFLLMLFFAGFFLGFAKLNTFVLRKNHLMLLPWGICSAFIVSILFLSVIQVFFVTHRRLHDLNASGWWQLITFIPFGKMLMIAFIFFKGTQGANRYGEPPQH